MTRSGAIQKNNFPIFASFLLAILCFSVFGEALQYPLINFDVKTYITANPMVLKGLTFESVKWAFVTLSTGDWQPLTWLSWMLDITFFGLNSFHLKLTNLLFHIANVLLLYHFLRRTTFSKWRPVMVAALYAIHPLRVESVVWVAERKDVLSTFFLMATCHFYASYAQGIKKRMNYGLMHLSFVLGLLSKPMLVTLPFALLLLDYWPLGRFQIKARGIGQLVKEKLGMMALSLVSCFITFKAAFHGHALAPNAEGLQELYIYNAFVSLTEYLSKTFWPYPLTFFYPHPLEQMSIVKLFFGIVFAVGLSYFVFKIRKRNPYAFLGWSWFLLTLIPVIGIVQTGDQGFADRYTYVPHLFFIAGITWAVAEIMTFFKLGKALQCALSISAVSLLSVLCWKQTGVWESSIVLNEHALAVTRNNQVAHLNLSFAYSQVGNYQEGGKHALTAFNMNPRNFRALNHLAYYHIQQGNRKIAKDLLEKALVIDPDGLTLRENLLALYVKDGEYEKALHHIDKLLAIAPKTAHLHKRKLKILITTGKYAEAVQQAQEMIAQNPAKAFLEPYTAAQIHFLKGEFEPAEGYFAQAIEMRPNDSNLQADMANLLIYMGQYERAIGFVKRAVELSPRNPTFNILLGNLYAETGQFDKAEAQFARAMRKVPDLKGLFTAWSALKIKRGEWEAALQLIDKLISLAPNSLKAEQMREYVLTKLRNERLLGQNPYPESPFLKSERGETDAYFVINPAQTRPAQ